MCNNAKDVQHKKAYKSKPNNKPMSQKSRAKNEPKMSFQPMSQKSRAKNEPMSQIMSQKRAFNEPKIYISIKVC